MGQPAPAILDCAVRLPADLIVMGTHGAGGFERFVLGSVAEKVLRRAACPVLTVPSRAHATSVLPFKRVVCAVDFSDSSLTALHYALIDRKRIRGSPHAPARDRLAVARAAGPDFRGAAA